MIDDRQLETLRAAVNLAKVEGIQRVHQLRLRLREQGFSVEEITQGIYIWSTYLHATNGGNPAARPGHLSSKAPLHMSRSRDEPGRVEELMRKRQNIGSYSKTNKKSNAHQPIMLNWKPAKAQ